MEKLKSFDWVYILLGLLALRSLIDASYPQAFIVMSFVGLKAYNDYLKSKIQKDLDAEVKKELSDMKNIVSGLSVKHAAKPQAQENFRFF